MIPLFNHKNLCRSVRIACLLIFLGSLSVEAQSIESDNLTYLRNLESEVVREINLARMEPQKYSSLMQDLLPLYEGNLFKRPGRITILTKEGVSAVNEAIEFLNSATPLKPLKLSRGMSRGAMDHVKDVGPGGTLGHKGSDNSRTSERVNRYGKWGRRLGENISYGRKSAREIVISLIVDDGVSSRGHRENIFNSSFNFIGVACGYHAVFDMMCVTTYAAEYSEVDKNE
ncbi:MAG: CAP domain-containing protein [Candidatus Scalindua sp.]|nr:CAP domain-containing protein [Candidatus Scalindua sp.]